MNIYIVVINAKDDSYAFKYNTIEAAMEMVNEHITAANGWAKHIKIIVVPMEADKEAYISQEWEV